MKFVKKAVFPVAGLGTRFIPATKAMPKEMLPIVDKPIIQYAVEEAVEAGITDMVFVTGRHKRAIEDHFDSAPELERELMVKGKTALLQALRAVVPRGINFIFIRQPEPLGLGHAILCAEAVIENEPFAVLLADDMIDAQQSAIGQLMEAREKNGGGNILAVTIVPRDKTKDYGIVELEEKKGFFPLIKSIVEKPDPQKAPSKMAVIGRYVLEPEIFQSLKKIGKGAGSEIQLTDAIAIELAKRRTYACTFEGKRFDCGSKQGFLDATIHYALKSGYRISIPAPIQEV